MPPVLHGLQPFFVAQGPEVQDTSTCDTLLTKPSLCPLPPPYLGLDIQSEVAKVNVVLLGILQPMRSILRQTGDVRRADSSPLPSAASREVGQHLR